MSTRLPLSRIVLLSFFLVLFLSTLSLNSAQPAKKSKKPRQPAPPSPPAGGAYDTDSNDQQPPAQPSKAKTKRPPPPPPPPPPPAQPASDDTPDNAPPTQRTPPDSRAATHSRIKASRQTRKGKGAAAADSTNGWLADIADTESPPYRLNIGTSKQSADVIADDTTQIQYKPHIETAAADSKDTDTTTTTTTATAAEADDNTTEVRNVADFYVWRRQTSDESVAGGKARSITMQRPMVFVQDDTVLEAAIQNWGARSMRLLPVLTATDSNTGDTDAESSAEPLTFTLLTTCKKAGTTYVNVALRSFEITTGARSRKSIEFSVKRTCSAAAAGTKTATTEVSLGGEDGGATTESTAADEGEATDVVHGAGSPFDIDMLRGGKETVRVLSHGLPSSPSSVLSGERRIDLSIRYSGDIKRTLNKPIIHVEQSAVFTVTDNLRNRFTMQHNDQRKFSLTFNCLAEGKSVFTVIFTVREDSEQQLMFAMLKECSGPDRTEGVAGLAIDVATSVGAHDVVDDGITQRQYAAIGKWDDDNWAAKADIVAVDESSSTFYITTTHSEGYRYEQPVVTAFSEDGTVIAQPKVSGSVVTTDPAKLTADEPLELVLEYRCEVDGVAGITVSLPITNVGSIQWTLRKQCSKPTAAQQKKQAAADKATKTQHEALGLSIDENNQTLPIAGLNIGFSRTAHGQMYNGVVESMYRLQQSTDSLAYCKSNRQFLTFYLYQNTSAADAVDVAFGKPEVITTSDISQPKLSGSLEGGVVNATSHASFTITFHCLVDGVTMYTLTIPLLPLAPNSLPPRSSITLSFLKHCNKSDNVLTVETGGVGIQGFRIGTTPRGNEVVSDGFPSIHYFGQKDRDDPNWQGIIVAETEVSASFYLTYTGGENVGEQTLHFQPPLVASHSSLVRPELSGSAAQGGAIKKNSAGLTLDITFNCRAAGLVPITVLLPINDGQIVFTIPKQCSGKALPQGVVHKGLMVGLTRGGSEVVRDGLVSPSWASGRGHIIRDDEDETQFWIYMTEGVFQAIEPMVKAYRSIAQPTLSHDMYVSMGPEGQLTQQNRPDADDTQTEAETAEEDAESESATPAIQQALENVAALRKNASEQAGSELVEDEMDDVYIDSRHAQLNVSYACFDEGQTRVIVTLPLKKGYLEWSWTKICGTGVWGAMASIVPANPLPATTNTQPAAGKNADVTWGKVGSVGGDKTVAGEGRIGAGRAGAPDSSPSPSDEEDSGLAASVLAANTDAHRAEVLPYGGVTDRFHDEDEFDSTWLNDRLLLGDELGGHHQNDPNEEHTDKDSKDFNRVNTLIVASSLKAAKARKGDVFHLNDGLRPKYKPPTSSSLASFAIIPADVERTSFWVTTTKSKQEVRRPTVSIPKSVRRERVGIEPRILLASSASASPSDDSTQQVELHKDDEPFEFVIEWQCSGSVGGITPVSVNMKLLPIGAAGELTFAVGKMCAGDGSGGGGSSGSGGVRGWSLYVLLLIGVVASVGALWWFGTKGGKEQLSDLLSAGLNTVNKARHTDTLQRGEYEIVNQKVPARRDADGI